MKAVKILTKTDESGMAEIRVATDIKNSDVSLIVVVENAHDDTKSGARKNRYDFSDLLGKVKWDEDPVEYQRRLREEW